MKAKDVLGLAKDRGAVMVDLKFMDFVGLWQHFTIPLAELKEEIFEEGLGFDGSSIRGWAEIHASDMLVMPDPTTAVMDPFMKDPTLSLICNISDPITKEAYGRDPRNIAIKAERYLKSTGIADTAYFGPEAEFFVFDEVRFDSKPNASFYEIGSSEAAWSTGKEEGNRGLQGPLQGGILPGRPDRQPAGHPHRDVPGARGRGHRGGAAAPRGGHRGSGGDRLPLQHPREVRGQPQLVQVHREERGLAPRQDGDVHAQAGVRGQRVRHAHPPVAVEERQAALRR
jgi:hypothetical protein